MIIATVDHQTGRLLTSPDIISRGFIYMRENEDLVQKARSEVRRIMDQSSGKPVEDWTFIKNNLRDELERFLFENTHRRPMVIPVIIEV